MMRLAAACFNVAPVQQSACSPTRPSSQLTAPASCANERKPPGRTHPSASGITHILGDRHAYAIRGSAGLVNLAEHGPLQDTGDHADQRVCMRPGNALYSAMAGEADVLGGGHYDVGDHAALQAAHPVR